MIVSSDRKTIFTVETYEIDVEFDVEFDNEQEYSDIEQREVAWRLGLEVSHFVGEIGADKILDYKGISNKRVRLNDTTFRYSYSLNVVVKSDMEN